MNELLQQVLGYLRGIWHRRWYGLAAAWLAAIIGVCVVYRIPNKYEASARVYVDTESLLRPLLGALAIQPNVDQQVGLISRTLLSRPNVEKLVRMADLDLDVKTRTAHDELVDSVTGSVRLDGNASTNLYVLSYRDTQPERARKIVQSLLTIFVESSLGDKRQDSRTAVKFIDAQVKRYDETLRIAENRLKEFKLKYMGVSGQGDYFGRLGAVQTAIESARLEMQAAEQSRDAYKRELAGETPTFMPEAADARSPEAVPEIDNRIAALKAEVDDLLRKFTALHPDVVAARRLIDQLEGQRTVELEARRKADPGVTRQRVTAPERNPMYQQLKFSLAEAEASVASARAKLVGYEEQYRQLKAKAQLLPEIEAEATALNRDYEVQKRTYEGLLSRREAGNMGIDVQDAGGAQFRVIDPPRVTPEPVAPNRLGLLGMVFVGSVLAGLFISFLVSQVMPIFHDARTLRAVSNRPILGMVSMLPSESLARSTRRRLYMFVAGLGSLFAAFLGVFAIAVLFTRAA
jgi:polysaccharide chain length determinant protein (PEP-CTERM system associated)